MLVVYSEIYYQKGVILLLINSRNIQHHCHLYLRPMEGIKYISQFLGIYLSLNIITYFFLILRNNFILII